MQLDPVEARLTRPPRRLGEERRQHVGQLPDVGQVHVPDPLAVAVIEGFELAVGQHGLERDAVGGAEVGAHVVVLGFTPARLVEPEGDLSPQ